MDQMWRDGEASCFVFAGFLPTTTSAKTFILEIPTKTIEDTNHSHIKSFVVIRIG